MPGLNRTSIAALLLLLPGIACAGVETGMNPAGKVLPLHAKDPTDWRIIPGGPAGQLRYDEVKNSFSFVGQGLLADHEYVLIRHADNPEQGQILARGRTDRNGRLEFQGRWNDWTQKFWLVPRDDIAETGVGPAGEVRARLTAWHPQRYLFEEKVLGIPCPCEE